VQVLVEETLDQIEVESVSSLSYRQNVALGIITSSGRVALSPLLASMLNVLDIFGFRGVLLGILGVLDVFGFGGVLLLLGGSPSLLPLASRNIFVGGISRGRCAFLLHLDGCRS
jgi:hypothetical protein